MKLPRFSLRTLMVLIALIAISMSWVGYQLNWIRQRHALESKLFVMHGAIHYPDNAPWSLRLFGEYGLDSISVRESEFAMTRRLFPEAKIWIYGIKKLSLPGSMEMQ